MTIEHRRQFEFCDVVYNLLQFACHDLDCKTPKISRVPFRSLLKPFEPPIQYVYGHCQFVHLYGTERLHEAEEIFPDLHSQILRSPLFPHIQIWQRHQILHADADFGSRKSGIMPADTAHRGPEKR